MISLHFWKLSHHSFILFFFLLSESEEHKASAQGSQVQPHLSSHKLVLYFVVPLVGEVVPLILQNELVHLDDGVRPQETSDVHTLAAEDGHQDLLLLHGQLQSGVLLAYLLGHLLEVLVGYGQQFLRTPPLYHHLSSLK